MSTNLARFVVFGEALTDVIRTGPDTWQTRAGGACWNIARVAAKLGLATGFGGAVSDDLFGKELVALSKAAGLNMAYTQQVSKDPFLAIVHETHPPQYFFVGTQAADLSFDFAQLPFGWEDAVECVHVGSLSLVREPLASRLVDKVKFLSTKGKKISYDPNWRNLMGPDYRSRFTEMLILADYIKVSDEDLSHLLPEMPPADALAWVLKTAGTATVMYTKGGDGLDLYTNGTKVAVPVCRVKVADTVGAGDASIGGWIFSLLTQPQRSTYEHGRFAAGCAAGACTHSGAHAPSLGEVEELLKEKQ